LEANPRAAELLKLCKSLCIPEFARPDQVKQLEDMVLRAEKAGLPRLDQAKIKEFLHETRNFRELQWRLDYLARGIDREIDIRAGMLSEIAERQAMTGRANIAAEEMGEFDVRAANRLRPRLTPEEPSAVLGRAMGGPPAPGMHAHHIVPAQEGGEGMQWLRDALERAGIDTNSARNGVWLAGTKAAENPFGTIPHTTYLHAGNRMDYLFTISTRLSGKEGPALAAELAHIKQELAGGWFQFLPAPRGWKPE
jgi:hypothetical protein